MTLAIRYVVTAWGLKDGGVYPRTNFRKYVKPAFDVSPIEQDRRVDGRGFDGYHPHQI